MLFRSAWLAVALAAGLDRLVGDPRPCPHPVVAMGWLIGRCRAAAEALAGDRPWTLRLAGALITLALVGGSGLGGWTIERLARGQWQMVVHELPPGTSTRRVLEEIDALTNPQPRPGKKSITPEQSREKQLMLSMLDRARDERAGWV